MRRAPFTLGWIFPEGGGARGRRDVTLGYMRGPRQHLSDLPEAANILSSYGAAIEQRLPSAEPVDRQNITGYMLSPDQVVSHLAEIEALLYDPQTSGGLLAALSESDADSLIAEHPDMYRVGFVKERGTKPIEVTD